MFSALPVELIEHILSFLEPDDKKTCAAVCRLSRLFHEVGTPRLYRSIIGVTFFDQDERFRRLQLLIRTLSRNLPLTQHVEEISQSIGKDSAREKPFSVDIDLEALRDMMSRNLGFDVSAFYFLEDGISEEFCLTVLLAICPRAQTLSFRGERDHLWEWLSLSDIVEEIRGLEYNGTIEDQGDDIMVLGGTSFHTIKNVHLERAVIDDLEPLLCLPALRTLRTFIFDHLECVSEPGLGLPPAFESRVETIEMENCFANGEDFDELLQYCPAVRSLTIGWPSRENNYRRFDWAVLGNAIRDHCPMLRYLRLDHPRDFMPDHDEFLNMLGDMNDECLQGCHLPGLGPMRSLPHLQSLHVSNIALFGTHRDDSFVAAGDSDSDDESEIKHCLENVTPESLKILLCFVSTELFAERI